MPSLTLSSLVYTPDFVGSTPHCAREEKGEEEVEMHERVVSCKTVS